MLDRDGLGLALFQVRPGKWPKMQKNGSCKGGVPAWCKNFGNFGQKRGKNIVNSIVGSIPPGRGYQLMPLFKAVKGRFWGYFSGLG